MHPVVERACPGPCRGVLTSDVVLAEFQQALADLVASPTLCRAIRDVDGEDATSLLDGYDLSPTERSRLVVIVRHRGMAANCTVYRSNRLTPIVINLPDTCDALGTHFRDIVDQFWASHPTEYFVHFLVESDRFATFVANLPPGRLPAGVQRRVSEALSREGAVVRDRLAATIAE